MTCCRMLYEIHVLLLMHTASALLTQTMHCSQQDYYRKSALSSGVQPFYILPHTRYEFDHPDGTGHEVNAIYVYI
jgi:hypothetical protein